MTISGAYRPTSDGLGPEAPFLRSTVFLPRFREFLEVNFLVDTGAESTVLALRDVRGAGLPDREFRQQPLRSVRGVGGEQIHYIESASMAFYGDVQNQTFIWNGQVRIPQHSDEAVAMRLPSILGRDFLNLCDLRLNWPGGLITLAPANVDAAGHILPP